MTSLADQGTRQLGGRWSILVRQKRDHVKLDGLLDELAVTVPGVEQDRVLHRIARLVFPHAFAEESVLWPEIRRRLPDGHGLTRRVEQEHQEVNQLWTTLEDSPSPDRRQQIIDRLMAVLREDVRDEEDVLLPRLQQAVSMRRLRMLGIAWEVVRRTAPDRPHPVVSRRPPGNALAAVPLTVLDHGRDVLDATARRAPRFAPSARSASRALARAAGRVERIGVLRVGEDPSTAVSPER